MIIGGSTADVQMMAQPPYEDKLVPYYILHYTYSNDYSLNGTLTPGKPRAPFAYRRKNCMPHMRHLSFLDTPPDAEVEVMEALI